MIIKMPAFETWKKVNTYTKSSFKCSLDCIDCATISLILYVHLSVCMEQSDSHWTDFHKISYFEFPNICQSILFWLKWTKIIDTGHESLCVCVCVVWSLAVMTVFITKTGLFSVRYRLSLKKHQARLIVNTCVAC